MLSNRANALCVLKILQEYSDENHILPMREIIEHLQKSYDIKMDRRTVYSTVELLQYLGYDVSTYEENGYGYYLRSHILEPSELRLLTDAVYSFPFISVEQSKKLIDKLQGVGSTYHRKRYRHLSVIRQGRKTENKQVFLNIELLDEAIEQKKKVSFTYLSYNEKLKPVPRRAKPYIVDPLGMAYTNEHYYLACTLTGCENTSLYRIDRMRGLSVLDEPTERTGANVAAVAENAIYAFVGAPEEITFFFDKGILNDVVDRFGTSIRLSDGGERYVAKVTASPRGVRFWALQYLSYVEVTEPRWLREEIVESVRRSPYTVLMDDRIYVEIQERDNGQTTVKVEIVDKGAFAFNQTEHSFVQSDGIKGENLCLRHLKWLLLMDPSSREILIPPPDILDMREILENQSVDVDTMIVASDDIAGELIRLLPEIKQRHSVEGRAAILVVEGDFGLPDVENAATAVEKACNTDVFQAGFRKDDIPGRVWASLWWFDRRKWSWDA